MASEQLRAYVKENLAKGYSPQELKDSLVQNGWDPAEVDSALKEQQAPGDVFSIPPPPTIQRSSLATSSAPVTKPIETPKASPSASTSSHREFTVKDALIILGVVIALCGVSYTAYILFVAP